jgi:starvation-inducible outer membrane lipoprotein
MKATLFIGCLALALTACQSTNNAASDSTAASSQEVARTANDGMICRNERETGSNMRVRVCRTAEQIERDRDEASDALRETRGTQREQND